MSLNHAYHSNNDKPVSRADGDGSRLNAKDDEPISNTKNGEPIAVSNIKDGAPVFDIKDDLGLTSVLATNKAHVRDGNSASPVTIVPDSAPHALVEVSS